MTNSKLMFPRAVNWRPSMTIADLKFRAEILKTIRQFFTDRDITEVETPILSHATVTDPHLDSLETYVSTGGRAKRAYLQTSPEFAMKRLLAAGSGPIYQMGKAFRDGESGPLHNPEFSMLEWYRPGFDHHDLMDEVAAFFQKILHCPVPKRYSYEHVFERYLSTNPHLATAKELRKIVERYDILLSENIDLDDRDICLQILMSYIIEPKISEHYPCFVYDFPSTQAALSKLRKEPEYTVAERFELYYKGMEIANGFHELSCFKEQAARFAADIKWRAENNKSTPEADERLLAALENGLPNCAGVAMGVDRLIMLALGYTDIARVMSFSFELA